VVCDEHGIGGSGEYFGYNNAHLDIISALYHESLGGKCDAENLVNHTCGQKLGQSPLQKGLSTNSSDSSM
jgi:hypothetical protein